MEVHIDTTMLAQPKGSSTLRIRAELEETLNANYPDYTPIYTDVSKMEERIGCAVVIPGENKEIRLPRPFSIFNAEAEASNTIISITRNTIQPKRVILSDSLTCLTALVERMINQIHRRSILFLCGFRDTPGSREIERPTNTLKRHCKGKPTRTTKPLQKTGKTG
jgi:hypothetical protein